MFTTDETFRKVRHYCHFIGKYRDAGNSVCNLRFNVSKKLANESVGQFKCLVKNTKKCKKISVPIGKESTKLINMGIKKL